MIVWIASYPKSGNTLVRSMLSSYFFSKSGEYNQDLIRNIKQFPSAELFENLGIDIKNENDVLKNYIKAQESFNLKKSIQFLKTHSYLFNIHNKYPFTDLNNSLGAIYIVRDPRNVVTSYSKFASLSTEKISEVMINQLSSGGNLDAARGAPERTTVYTGTWSSNFQSWKSFKDQERYLLIKYEELIEDPEKNFIKILKFIHKLNKTNFIINQNKLRNVLKTTTFDYMKKLEKENGFIESKKNSNDGKLIPFFNLGPKNDWRKLLDSKIKIKIEKAFKKEMEELKYL